MRENVKRTPQNDVTWSGARGQSKCYPNEPSIREKLAEHGQEYIRYNHQGEPDFGAVAEAKVQITNMNSSLSHDKMAADKKLLNTSYAKEHNLHTVQDVAEHRQMYNLVWHESSDGVTECLVDQEIHSFFRHAGGRAEYRKLENGSSDNFIQQMARSGKIELNRKIVVVKDGIQEIAVDLNSSPLDVQLSESIQAGNAAVASGKLPLLTSAVTNTMLVAEGEMSADEAISDTVMRTGGVWIEGVAKNKAKNLIEQSGNQMLLEVADIAQMPEVITAVVAIGGSFVKMVDGEISDEEFALCVGSEMVRSQMELIVASVAGQLLVPIPVVGELVGAVIVSAVCDQIDRACRECLEIHKSLKHISDNAHEISSLANRARSEIEEQRQTFQNYTKQYNAEIQQQITAAFQTIRRGIDTDSYETTSDGLEMVATIFGETTADLDMDWLERNWKGGN